MFEQEGHRVEPGLFDPAHIDTKIDCVRVEALEQKIHACPAADGVLFLKLEIVVVVVEMDTLGPEFTAGLVEERDGFHVVAG